MDIEIKKGTELPQGRHLNDCVR